MIVYIASPFFTPEQLKIVQEIESDLVLHNINFYSPRCEGIIKDMTPEEKQARAAYIYRMNVEHIHLCNSMIAMTDNFDPGTIFEIGYAAALGKKIVTVSPAGYGANVMLVHCATHVKSIRDGVRCLAGKTFQCANVRATT